MLSYPEAESSEDPLRRARFGGLTREKIYRYISLAGATSGGEGDMDLPEAPRELLEQLLSGDDALVEDAVAQVEGREPSVQEAMRQALLPSLTDLARLPAVRAGAGLALGRLGDPRSGVGLNDSSLPDIEWVGVESGPFVMGDDQSAPNYEKPQFTCRLVTQPYRIARYPVTVVQYGAFVEDRGYEESRWWTDAGWAWRTSKDITGPAKYAAPFQTPNHPQVGVSWYEAVAFCAWLSARLSQAILLPSEAQWERAARHTDGRVYPWGNEGEPAEHCNMGDTGLGRRTSAVGVFPNGDAECGATDMAGNVWEWCSTKWLDNYEGYAERVSDDLAGDESRVLLGGAFLVNRDGVRCAFRFDLDPGARGDDLGFRILSPGL